MTADRLRGAGASNLSGVAADVDLADLLYFSFTVLTSTGFGDMSPLARPARSLCVLEQLIGALFVSILIARLAGLYPPRRGRIPADSG